MRYVFPCFPDGKYKAVTFSYDDGCRSDLKLAQMLDSYHIKCTFNISSELIEETSSGWHLTADEIQKYILDSGHEVAVHGAFHKAPGLCRPAEYIKDISDCRSGLEKTFGRIIRGMAYPDSGIRKLMHGNSREQIKETAKALGIAYSRTLGGDNDKFEIPNDWYEWMPTAHHTNPNVLDYARKFTDLEQTEYCSNQSAKLFYLWGHSFEFDRDNNWELAKQICEILGGKEDIWYATNIEICDYLCAYEGLRLSYDGSMVYNPSVHDVWIFADGKCYRINSGETVELT